MYNASADFNTKIKLKERLFTYSGSIVTTGGTTYTYDGSDMRSGKIVRAISGQSLEIGTVYASEYDVDLGLNVSRYELYNGTIDLSIMLDGASDVIPMGIFTISEVTQTADRLHIKAYDNMVKFDSVDFNPSSHLTIQKPYEWLTEMCTACSVTLGSTSAQISVMPNGSRKTGFADVVSDVKSWRDVLGYLATYLGGYAYIGRDGKLYIGQYGSTSADTVPASFRYSSNLSDYRTTYDGLYATYKEGGVQEYVANSNSGGIVLDIGVNPFLQFTDQTNRLDALAEIIDAWNGVYYVPYDSDMPLVPTYDPGDVLTFTDNQASVYDVGAITEITYNVGGQMHVRCSGDNPRLSSAEDRFSKTVAGLASDYNNGQEVGGKAFWLLHTENTSNITLDYGYIKVAEIEWNQTVDVMRLGLMFTCEVSRSATGVVNVMLTVDGTDSDPSSYTFEVIEQKSSAGKRIHSVTCAFRVTGKGKHSARVYVQNLDSPLRWSEFI